MKEKSGHYKEIQRNIIQKRKKWRASCDNEKESLIGVGCKKVNFQKKSTKLAVILFMVRSRGEYVY